MFLIWGEGNVVELEVVIGEVLIFYDNDGVVGLIVGVNNGIEAELEVEAIFNDTFDGKLKLRLPDSDDLDGFIGTEVYVGVVLLASGVVLAVLLSERGIVWISSGFSTITLSCILFWVIVVSIDCTARKLLSGSELIVLVK